MKSGKYTTQMQLEMEVLTWKMQQIIVQCAHK